MADDKFVPVEDFVKVTKILLEVIHDLTVSMQVQRVALMNINSVLVSPDYLKRLAGQIRDAPELRAVRETIGKLTTTDQLTEFLRKFEGTIQ